MALNTHRVSLAGGDQGKRRAHTCLESPQVSSRHSELVAPLSVAHVRGEAVIQSISCVTQEPDRSEHCRERDGKGGVPDEI